MMMCILHCRMRKPVVSSSRGSGVVRLLWLPWPVHIIFYNIYKSENNICILLNIKIIKCSDYGAIIDDDAKIRINDAPYYWWFSLFYSQQLVVVIFRIHSYHILYNNLGKLLWRWLIVDRLVCFLENLDSNPQPATLKIWSRHFGFCKNVQVHSQGQSDSGQRKYLVPARCKRRWLGFVCLYILLVESSASRLAQQGWARDFRGIVASVDCGGFGGLWRSFMQRFSSGSVTSL